MIHLFSIGKRKKKQFVSQNRKVNCNLKKLAEEKALACGPNCYLISMAMPPE